MLQIVVNVLSLSGAACIYSLSGIAFSTIATEIQWVLVPVIVLVRVITKWMHKTLAYMAAGEDGEGKFSIQFVTHHCVKTRHAVYVAIIIGGVATPETSTGMIITNLLINVHNCIKNVRRHKLGIEGEKVFGVNIITTKY